MHTIAVIGIGNILRRDDGIGIRVIEFLESTGVPSYVKLIQGDISGLDLIKYFEYNRVIIVDAAKMGIPAGTVKIFTPEDIILNGFKDAISTHSIGLKETLRLANSLKKIKNIQIIGIEPYNIEFGLEITKELQKKVPDICNQVIQLVLPGLK